MSETDWAIVLKILEVILALKLLFIFDFPIADLSLDKHSLLAACFLHIYLINCIDGLWRRLLIRLHCYGKDHRLLERFVFTAAL